MAEENKGTQIPKPLDVVTSVAMTLRNYTQKGDLVLPTNYSIENALKSAWLILQETTDKERRPVLQACSQASIANALLDMAVQGLNPGKKQCYFIAYGQKLMCQRSYFGTMAVAQRVANASDIWAEIVYQGDDFEYTISHNRKNITKHTQRLENVHPNKIIAAYCIVEFGGGKLASTEIMTMEQIRKAWAKSKMNPDSPTSTHSQYPEEMCKRTVINRACKPLINASSDSNLFLESFNRADDEQVEGQITAEIAENANQEILDVDPGTGEIIQEQPKAIAAASEKPKRDPMTIKNYTQLCKACHEDFALQPKQVLAELGVSSEEYITQMPADCYAQIAAIMTGPKEGPGF